MRTQESVRHVEAMPHPIVEWGDLPVGVRRGRLLGRSVSIEPLGMTVEALQRGVSVELRGTLVRVPVMLGRPFRVGGGKATDLSRPGTGWWGVEARTQEGGRGMLAWDPVEKRASGMVRMTGGGA